jgi:thiamine biosynthesis protein ThiS
VASISIVLNGDSTEVEDGLSLLELVEGHLGRDPRTVAVERNGDIVARQAYGGCQLVAGDRLEVVHFVQGG